MFITCLQARKYINYFETKMTTIEGILVLNSGDGSLIYDNEVKKHYGLKAALGGNELQLCAMLYTLFISSTSVNEESGEATSSRSTAHIDGETVNDYSLHWIKSVSQWLPTAQFVVSLLCSYSAL